MGRNKIGSILTQSRKLYSFKGKKVANHSVRKTSLGQLLDSNVAETFVAQHAGMKSIDSLKSYKSPGVMKISEMSDVLTSVKRDIIIAKENNIVKQNPVSGDIDFSCSQSSCIAKDISQVMILEIARITRSTLMLTLVNLLIVQGNVVSFSQVMKKIDCFNLYDLSDFYLILIALLFIVTMFKLLLRYFLSLIKNVEHVNA